MTTIIHKNSYDALEDQKKRLDCSDPLYAGCRVAGQERLKVVDREGSKRVHESPDNKSVIDVLYSSCDIQTRN